MKIGIIVYSKTGNTLAVANRLYEQYLKLGHTVNLERVIVANDAESTVAKMKLTNAPKIDQFDLLVFCAPVNGFRLSLVMQAYLNQLPSLKGKVVMGFVTQYFPYSFLGGKQAIKGMTKLCLAKGVEISKTSIINWKNPLKKEQLIVETIDKFQV